MRYEPYVEACRLQLCLAHVRASRDYPHVITAAETLEVILTSSLDGVTVRHCDVFLRRSGNDDVADTLDSVLDVNVSGAIASIRLCWAENAWDRVCVATVIDLLAALGVWSMLLQLQRR